MALLATNNEGNRWVMSLSINLSGLVSLMISISKGELIFFLQSSVLLPGEYMARLKKEIEVSLNGNSSTVSFHVHKILPLAL